MKPERSKYERAPKPRLIRFKATSMSDRRRCAECRAFVRFTDQHLTEHARKHGARDYSVEQGVIV